MWQYFFSTLRRRPGQSLLAGSGFLLVACTLILLSATTLTTVLRTKQIISQNWRPAYDLVVLPRQETLPNGKAVPPDFFASYNGGISLQQYQQIRQIAGVEVAAPIAFIGYAQLPRPIIRFSPRSGVPGYYLVHWTLTAFDGRHHLVEQEQSAIYYNLGNNPCTSDFSSNALNQALSQQNIILYSCGASNDNTPAQLSLPSFDTGTFLLAAIDQTAENQLTHIDQSVVAGRMLSAQDTTHLDPLNPSGPGLYGGNDVPDYDLPLLFEQHLPGQISLSASVTQLTGASLPPHKALQLGGFNYLTHLAGQQTIFRGTVPLVQDAPQSFSDAVLTWNGQSWQTESFRAAGPILNFLYAPSGLTYQTANAPASWQGASYQLVPSDVSQAAQKAPGEQEAQYRTFVVPQDEATFRNLQPTYIAETPQPYNLPPIVNANYFSEQIGQFRGDELATQFSDALNWLPEATYAPPPVILRYDAQGHPVPPTSLLPTANPAGFIIQPPLALTTIQAAAQLKGNDSISVIRVRVSGVSGANEASWQHVAQVAQAIERSTGLRALVTLGSSPEPTLVYVPGVSKGQDGAPQTVAPLGWVEERWIYIGAGIVYLREAGQTQILLLGAVLAVCLGYLVVTLSSLVSSGRRETAILSALGWRPWQPARLFLSQALLLALGGGVVGIALALLIILLIGASPPWLMVGLALPAVLLLALLSSLYPLWQLWRIRPIEVLRDAPAVVARAEGSQRKGWAPPLPLPLRNLLRSRGRALIALGCLFLSALLLVVLVSGILAFRQTLQGTLLGNFVLLQTALPQVVGVLAALLLTFLSVADLLLLQVRERQREIGLLLAVGWRPWQVQRLFVQEGMQLALVGAIPGVLAGWGVLAVQHSVQNIVSMPLLIGAVVLLLMGVAAGAAVPALRAMGRMQVMDVLRAE